MRRFPRIPALITAVSALLSACSSAQAAIVTVGSPTTTPVASVNIGNPATIIDSALGEPGANLISPISGTIIRWHVTGFVGGPFRLRVLTPLGAEKYTGSGTSAPQTPSSKATQTYATNLPIKAGQMIAMNNTNATDEEGYIAAGSYSYFVPPLADGATGTAVGPFAGAQFLFNAEVQPLPGVSAVGPAGGSIKGGTSIVIAGHDFTGATSVTFGGSAASSFSVQSEGSITAIAPSGISLGPVDVTVTTLAGTSSLPAAFNYEGCLVPKLKGKRLKASKKALRKRDCKIGKVKKLEGATAKTGEVVKQNPKPGKVLAPGSKVSVKLG